MLLVKRFKEMDTANMESESLYVVPPVRKNEILGSFRCDKSPIISHTEPPRKFGHLRIGMLRPSTPRQRCFQNRRSLSLKKLGALGFLVVSLCLLSLASYYYSQHRSSSSQPNVNTTDEMFMWNSDFLLALSSGHLPGNVKPHRYDITLHIPCDWSEQDSYRKVEGTVSIEFTQLVSESHYIVLHTRHQDITAAHVFMSHIEPMESPLSQNVTDISLHPEVDFLVIKIEQALIRNRRYTLSLEFTAFMMIKDGRDSRDSGGIVGEVLSNRDSSNVYKLITADITPLYCRRVFPCFDEPGLRAVVHLTVTHEKSFKTISNLHLESTNISSHTVSKFSSISSIPCHAIKFYVTNLECAELKRSNKIILSPDNGTVDVARIADKIERLMKYIEVWCGMRYHENNYTEAPLNLIITPDLLPVRGYTSSSSSISRQSTDVLQTLSTNLPPEKQWMIPLTLTVQSYWVDTFISVSHLREQYLSQALSVFLSIHPLQFTLSQYPVRQLFMVDLVNSLNNDVFYNNDPLLGSDSISHASSIMASAQFHRPLTLSKGCYLFVMLADILGENCFRKSINIFFSSNRHQSVMTDDLVVAMQSAVISNDVKLPAGISELIQPWLYRIGYPVVTIERDYTTGYDTYNIVRATQQWFLLNKRPFQQGQINSGGADYLWNIPLHISVYNDAYHRLANHELTWLLGDSREIQFEELSRDNWFLGNVGRTGYYRVNYDVNNWSAIFSALKRDVTVMCEIDRTGLYSDVFNFVKSGHLQVEMLLSVFDCLEFDRGLGPWVVAQRELGYIAAILNNYDDDNEMILAKLSTKLVPLFEYHYWHNVTSGSDEELSRIVLMLSCVFRQPLCLSEARKMLVNLERTELNNTFTTSYVNMAMLCCVVHASDAVEYVIEILSQSGNAGALLYVLHCYQSDSHVELVSRALGRDLSTDVTVNELGLIFQHNQLMSEQSRIFKQIAWLVLSHPASHNDQFFSTMFREALIENLSQYYTGYKDMTMVSELLDPPKHNSPQFSHRSADNVLERIQNNIDWIDKNIDQLKHLLSE